MVERVVAGSVAGAVGAWVAGGGALAMRGEMAVVWPAAARAVGVATAE